MKRVLGVMCVVVIVIASMLAQSSKQLEQRNEAKDFAPKVKFQPKASTPATPTPNTFPIFTDNSGTLGNSVLTQVINTTTTPPTPYLGLGTTNPQFNMHFVSTVDPAAVVVEGYGVVGINFMGRRARGTPDAPQALQTDDNIMAMQGRGYGATAFSPYSRAYMKFFAAENWTDTAQGTYITLATSTKGTAGAAERLRVLDNGYVGIGTSTPDQMLTVVGSVHITSGGLVFADGTAQTTAGGGGTVTLTSPDSTINISGNALTVNTGKIQARVSGTCASGSAVTGVNGDGSVACGTIGPNGSVANIPVVVANTTVSGSYGAGTAQTVYTAAADGFYRVTVYMNVPTMGTCSSAPCAGETMTIQWNDGVSTTALATANCNLVTPCGSSYTTPIWVKSGQAITAYGQSWGTGTAPTGGNYNAYILVEQL